MRLPEVLRRDSQAIPLTDAPSLRRQAQRTWAVRLALGAGLVACLLVAIGVSRDASGSRRTFFSTAKSSVVVIDISGSIGPQSRELIGRTLRRLLDARNSFGLVFFSDTAYEAVPPGTRWTELQPLLQYFQPPPAPTAEGRRRRVQDTPWAAFRGGTRISTGLDLARSMLIRTHEKHAGVLLISDLNNSIFDGPALSQTLARYVGDKIPLRVIGLNSEQRNEVIFRRVLGRDSMVDEAELAKPDTTKAGSVVTATGGTSAALTAAALLLLLGLGANEHWAARVRWRSEEAT
jgi:hypothetical protein